MKSVLISVRSVDSPAERSNMKEILIAMLTGGAVVAVIEGIREAIAWYRNRKAVKEDRAEEKDEYEQKQRDLKTEDRLTSIEKKMDAQNEAMKYVLYDRIRYLGQAYIAEGEIDFDDRRILNNMHHSYHFGLCGNGDLDTLMNEVNHLPLKRQR